MTKKMKQTNLGRLDGLTDKIKSQNMQFIEYGLGLTTRFHNSTLHALTWYGKYSKYHLE